ncbi:DUF87 domain-containing protein [Haematospirillum jordaniae]|uniref:DNA translocase FtsK n=1 Tax=Haematospirillum jordaniae TaxID=1549855 RepID=A0A143DCE5_9PROT|nr:DNA translocase FtsK [Haematospirillum jordaniae]AMW34392.1 cell division protein FtsK [Haematospirillum jordaniae]NKD44633.1 DUF87 domain-containing protein [Haematospirillum jordaniae]NKD57653.1 DUF87 domain-containing protein [Haematospirillum jordaniae]NKD59223.1 DUF87 domain-containing protein [Haematospirillum jordaniae]NKD67361.1 DUF87 domain-containing protein [Haematospirillum jordaniae]
MARAQADNNSLLSSGARQALARIGRRLGGLMLLAGSFALGTALATYAPTDPSLNTAGPHLVNNALGKPGALFADAMIQGLGIASALPVLMLSAWGIRMILAGRITWGWLRLVLCIPGSMMISIVPAWLPRPDSWTAPTGIGGMTGSLLLEGAHQGLMTGTGSVSLMWVVVVLCGLAGTALVLWTSMLRWREFQALAKALSTAGRQTGQAIQAIVSWRPFPAKGTGYEDTNDENLAWHSSSSSLNERSAQHREANPYTRIEPRMDPAPGPSHTPDPVAPLEQTEEYAGDIITIVPPTTPKSAPHVQARTRTPQSVHDLTPARNQGFQIPPLDLLSLPVALQGALQDDRLLSTNARLLESVLQDFGVNGRIVEIRPGPVVTLYALDPAPGTKTSRVISLADDIARSMSALSVRIAVVPGQSTIGIELPNSTREMVSFRALLSDDSFNEHPEGLILALGRDIGGSPVQVDLSRMPHLLIAGTTGSGKSVAVNTMICSLLFRMTPDQVRFIMIDPKMLELSVYDGIPHLLSPVVTDPGKAVVALKWAVREMETRYRAMSQMGVRNIGGYNQKLREASTRGEPLTRTVQTGFDPETGKPVFEEQQLDTTPLPYIVVIVDEMADLMLVAGKDVEAAIQRLAQMARAAGIHLIMATQRPSVDVITGTIKANFPTRISFQVTSKIDSRTILGEQGAEQLLGQGDMLYMAAGGRITRVHGPFVSDAEVEEVATFLRAQGAPDYVGAILEDTTETQALPGTEGLDAGSESPGGLFDQAVALVARERKASTSFIQRHLQIGYNRAARIIEQMEKEGMVSRANHVGKREVLLPPPHDEAG